MKKDILVFNFLPWFQLILSSYKNTHIWIFLSLEVMTFIFPYLYDNGLRHERFNTVDQKNKLSTDLLTQ